MDSAETFGQRIKKYRDLAGLTQEQLAEAVGTSEEHISIIENGVHMPRPKTIVKLAETLNVSTDILLGVKRKGFEWESEIAPIMFDCDSAMQDDLIRSIRLYKLGLIAERMEKNKK